MRKLIFIISTIMLMSIVNLQADDRLTDPYEIIFKHYEAIGGLDKVKAEKTSYAEATISLAGMSGTFKQWAESPLKSRQDLDLGVFKQVGGDNGEFSWAVDANDKVKINKDEPTLVRRDLNRKMAEFEHLNRDSDLFSISFEGTDTAGGEDCYVLKISNQLNKDYQLMYIAVGNFYNLRSIEVTPDQEMENNFSDFREVGGVIHTFKVDVTPKPIGSPVSLAFTNIETNIEIDPEIFNPPGKDVRDFEFTAGEHAENISFMFKGNHLYIPVIINGREKLWCLDTGAGMTVIDSLHATRLNLELQGNMEGSGAGNAVQVYFTTLPEYYLEGLRFDQQNVAVIKLHDIFYRWDIDVQGILGYDFLSRFVVKVDYANELISFYDPEKFEYTGDGVVLEAAMDGNMITAPLTVDKKYAGQWRLDLGAGSTSFHYPYAEENGLLEIDGVKRVGMGAGGTFEEQSVKFNSVEFAGFTLNDFIVDMPTAKGVGAFASGDYVGNIGNTLLRHFVIYIDYEKQQLIVEKGSDFGKDFPEDKSGLQVWKTDDDQYEVLFVSPGTPADKAGLKEGDILISINNIALENFKDLYALKNLLSSDTQKDIEIVTFRDEKEIKRKLKLKYLY